MAIFKIENLCRLSVTNQEIFAGLQTWLLNQRALIVSQMRYRQ
jgi:hypothetical protein